ncbi:MAG: hypothetical protein ABSB71_05030 [Candidatus Bathyarchaeia archaeon]|jgi:hypothetical protein
MKTLKNKIAAISIAILLTISMSASMTLIPSASAHTPPWQILTYAFLNVDPNPVGVGQTAYVNFWIDSVPPTAAGQWGDRWYNMAVTVTKPDGTTETLGPLTSDPTGGTWASLVVDQVGNYTFVGHFPQQTATNENPYPYITATMMSNRYINYVNDTYLASTSNVVTLTVQEEPIPTTPAAPLPTAYWTRPINSMNREWSIISGNWLGTAETFSLGNYRPYTTGPTTGHIIWTKPIAFGGQIGGEFGSTSTSLYATGAAYETKFATPIIINGILYYTQFPGAWNNPGPLTAVNLQTGQTLWTENTNGILAYGMVYNFITGDQYGAHTYLFTYPGGTMPTGFIALPNATLWSMYEAMTGQWILNIANATPGTIVDGPQGELLSYRVSGGQLTMWNASLCIAAGSTKYNTYTVYSSAEIWRPPQGATIDWAGGNQWSVPVATTYEGAPISLGISEIDNASGVVLMQMTAPETAGHATEGWRIEAGYSLTTGQQLWITNRTITPWTTIYMGPAGNGIYTEYNEQLQSWSGYSILTGNQLWGPTQPYTTYTNAWGYFDRGLGIIAYGNFYTWSLSGAVYCYNLTTGTLNWFWSTGPAGYDVPYGNYPLWSLSADALVANGMVYVVSGHSYTPPVYKGSKLYAINATTGQLVFNILDFNGDGNGPYCTLPISDGIMITENSYDNQLYAFGMGPSKTTVTAPNIGVTTSTPVTITGTVTDISAGSQQNAVAMNFPNGLPAVSDASQTAWMEYVYEQQPMPTNTTGVPVTISVVDSNGNYRTIGTTTTNSMGTFGFNWTPDIPGNFTVTATFAGSQSYYGSSASTYFYASAPAPTASPQQAAAQPPTGMYIAAAAIAIIVAIAIASIVIVLMLRKRP